MEETVVTPINALSLPLFFSSPRLVLRARVALPSKYRVRPTWLIKRLSCRLILVKQSELKEKSMALRLKTTDIIQIHKILSAFSMCACNGMSHKDSVMLFHPPMFSSDTPPTGLFDEILIFRYCIKSQLTKLEANVIYLQLVVFLRNK